MPNFTILKHLYMTIYRKTPLPLVLMAALLIIILWTGWKIVVVWLAHNQQLAAVPLTTTQTPAASPQIAFSAVPEWHLFGHAPAENTAPPTSLPDTTLQLQLLGILQANDPTASQAIIAGPDGQGKIYRIGDFITNDVKLNNILSYEVILDRGKEQEKLQLPKNSVEFGPNPQGF